MSDVTNTLFTDSKFDTVRYTVYSPVKGGTYSIELAREDEKFLWNVADAPPTTDITGWDIIAETDAVVLARTNSNAPAGLREELVYIAEATGGEEADILSSKPFRRYRSPLSSLYNTVKQFIGGSNDE